ncbi:MAG: BolA/IbaG family iron-sulfur metabolism protein [Alphaproteobacteria bacterium]
MALALAEIKNRILAAIPDANVRIEDVHGNGSHYAAWVESKAFIGKNRVQQHQMVFAALKGAMDSDLHALALQTSIPED